MIKLTLFSRRTLTSLLGLLALLVDFSSAQGTIDYDFPLTHAKLVELSAIKHLCRRLPVEIKCSAFKDKLREIAVKDDGSLFRLTIEAIRSKRVPFKNNKYLVSDLETCKRLLGPTEELQGEALAYAKLRAVTRELEQLKEVLKFKEQSKEERDRPIHSVPDQAKLTFKLLGSEIYVSSYMERCYVYYILFGKQRPLSTQDIESVVRMQPGLSIFKAPPTVSAATKQSLKELSEHLMQYQSMEYSNPAEEIRSCIDELKTIN